jgi:hypothetical protein
MIYKVFMADRVELIIRKLLIAFFTAKLTFSFENDADFVKEPKELRDELIIQFTELLMSEYRPENAPVDNIKAVKKTVEMLIKQDEDGTVVHNESGNELLHMFSNFLDDLLKNNF